MEIPTAQEKSEQVFFVQPKVHQFKFADTNRTLPTNSLKLMVFFKQCQVANKAAGVLERIAKDKKQPQEKKMGPLPTATATIIKATDAVTTTNNPTIIIEMIDDRIVLVTKIRTLKAASPKRRNMITSAITSRKRVTRPCTMTSPLC
jgi:hypothetical protein